MFGVLLGAAVMIGIKQLFYNFTDPTDYVDFDSGYYGGVLATFLCILINLLL